MRHTEIEALMTEKVAEYIAKGYILSTSTMGGSQGEIARVDLKKGTETIHILLTGENAWDDNGIYRLTTLIVGRASEQLHKSHPFDTMALTIWNDELMIIEERKFYSIDSNKNLIVIEATVQAELTA